MQFLMRFLVRFRVQNAPYPTLHEYFFHEASRWLERKLSHIISRHPSFQFLLTWWYFVAELRDYKPVRGRLWQVLFAKSHRNRTKNRMCKRAFRRDINSLDWHWTEARFPKSVLFTKILTFWTTQKLIDCSLMSQTAWSTSWTRRIERQNSFWNPFAPTRKSTWRSRSLSTSGDNIQVTCLELANQRVRRFERSFNGFFAPMNGRLSVLWWCDRPFLVEFELVIWVIPSFVFAQMGLQTRRGMS